MVEDEDLKRAKRQFLQFIIGIIVVLFIAIFVIPPNFLKPSIRNAFCHKMPASHYIEIRKSIHSLIKDKNQDTKILEIQLGLQSLSPGSFDTDEWCCTEPLVKAYDLARNNLGLFARYYLWYSDLYVKSNTCLE